MISLDSIVSKNIGIFEKNPFGGITRKSAENALMATAKDVETNLLKDKNSAIALQQRNFEEIKAKQIEKINQKDAEILDLSDKNKALEEEKASLIDKILLLSDENSSLKSKVGNLVTKLETKMPFKLINVDKDGNRLFAKPNRNGARMLKTISKDGFLSKLEVVLLDGTSRLLFDSKKQEAAALEKAVPKEVAPSLDEPRVIQNKVEESKSTDKPEQSRFMQMFTKRTNKKDIQRESMYKIRKHFINTGVELKEPWINPNIPKNGVIVNYDKKTGNVLKKLHYITPESAPKNVGGIYNIGELSHVDEFNPQTGKITQRKIYNRNGYLDRIQKFNEAGKLVEQAEYQNFRATYDCVTDKSYLQEYLYIRRIDKYDPETGKTLEQINGKGEKIWTIAIYTEKDGLKFSNDEAMTAGKWNLGSESNVFPVMVPQSRDTSCSKEVYWKLNTFNEAPLPEMTKIYEIRKYDQTGNFEVVKPQKN